MVSHHPDHSEPQPTPDASSGGPRARIEDLSMPALTGLSRIPAVLPFIIVLALILTGAFVGGALGAVLLALPVLFLAWLLYLTWPHLRMPERLLRLAVLLLVLAIAVTQVVPS